MTKSSLATQRQLLNYLRDGCFHSGQMLAEAVGISRTAIANHIAALQQLGLDVYKVKGRGYSLAQPLLLLDAAKMLQMRASDMPDIQVHSITDSTNSQLMQKIQSGSVLKAGSVLVAEAQTSGRGRRGRSWYSPFGASLYFSMYWRLEQGVAAAMGLSLVVAISVARVLQQYYNLEATVKWPNDVYIDGKKLCGILVELAGQAQAECDVIIGIGINIQLPEHSGKVIDQQYIDLNGATQQRVDRNSLVVQLQQQLIEQLNVFSQEGFSPFVAEFNRYNHYQHKKVKLTGSQNISGICLGVDERGAILLETTEGKKPYFGGELSLRAGD